MRDIIVLSGSSHPSLTSSICRHLSVEQGIVNSTKFSNGETSITIHDSVREKDVFIIQSGCGNVNDSLIELIIMISACKTASAKRVTAVLPLFPYSRQPDVPTAAAMTGAPSISMKKDSYTFESAPGTPRPTTRHDNDVLSIAPPTLNLNGSGLLEKAAMNNIKQPSMTGTKTSKSDLSQDGNDNGYKQWISQNGTLIANLLVTSGSDRIITMDLHDPQFQGFFDVPVDNLYSKALLKRFIVDTIPNYQDCVIVSPDSGGAKRATSIADALGCSFALIHKERRAHVQKTPSSKNSSSASLPLAVTAVKATTMLVGDVKDRVCVLVDDIVDTSYTITRAAKLLKDQGASYVYALVSHGVFSGDALNRIAKSDIDKIITTNSVPETEHLKTLGADKLQILDVSRVFAEAIRRIHNGESVSMLFDHGI